MKQKELENINNELFSALNLDDQQYIVGAANRTVTVCEGGTFSPTQGTDVQVDIEHDGDWS